MLRQDTAAAVLEEALTTGGDFAEIFLEDKVSHSLTLQSDRIETVGTSRKHGAGLRDFAGPKDS